MRPPSPLLVFACFYAAAVSCLPLGRCADPELTVGSCWSAIETVRAMTAAAEAGGEGWQVALQPTEGVEVPVLLLRNQIHTGLMLESQTTSTAKYLEGGFERYPLGVYVVHVGVNNKRATRTVAVQDLALVLRGKTQAWQGLDRSAGDVAINLVGKSLDSTDAHVLNNRVLGHGRRPPKRFGGAADKWHDKLTSGEVVNAVLQDINAIGFFSDAPKDFADRRIRILGVATEPGGKGVVPDRRTIADGSYPLVDRLVMYVHPDAPASAHGFRKFATGPKAAKILEQFGWWPEHDLESVRQQQRLADVRAGRGTPLSISGPASFEVTAKAFSMRFIETKAAVQLRYKKSEGPSGSQSAVLGEPSELSFSFNQHGHHPSDPWAPAPRRLTLGKAAMGVVVHRDNELTALPLDELEQICTGKIADWRDGGRADIPIRGYALQARDPVMGIYRDILAAKSQERAGRGLKLTALADTQKVVLAVARDPAGIGFVDISRLPKDESSIKLLPIMLATQVVSTPAPGRVPDNYPLVFPVTLHVSPTAGKTATDFADFLAEEDLSDILTERGLLPVNRVNRSGQGPKPLGP